MACCRHIFRIATILLFLDFMLTVEVTPEDLPKDLPVTKDQLKLLAVDVCGWLYGTAADCEEKFINSKNDISLEPATLKFECRKQNKATYSLDKSGEMQLVILVPDSKDGEIGSKITRASDQTATAIIEYLEDYNYTFWTTSLLTDGTHSVWRKGPDLPPWREYRINTTIEEPILEYFGHAKRYQAVFTINVFGELNPCTVLNIVNSCEKDDLGRFYDKTFQVNTRGNQTTLKLPIRDLPINDKCSLKIFSNGNLLSPNSEATYHTPIPGQTNLPEKVENVTLVVMATTTGYDVKVTWIRPNLHQRQYNLTLRTLDVIYPAVVSGLETNYTFVDVKGEEGADFSVSIVSITQNGTAKTSRLGHFPLRPSYQAVIITGSWSVILTVTAALTGLLVWWRRRTIRMNRKRYFTSRDIKLPKDCLMESCPEQGMEDGWELRSERILLHEVIGEGAFGVVRRGTLAPGAKEVAVKMLKDFPTTEEVRSFRSEMELMKSVGAHPHIVSLVGCCTGRRPLIVAEYCSRGDLLSFLRCSWDVMVSKRNAKYYNNNIEGSDYRNDLFKKQKDPNFPIVINKLYDLQGLCDTELTPLDLLSFCRQIAMGMEFLASNRVVHRDLAARNILVTGDRTLKIADFGLSRDVYQENQYKQKGNGKLPVKWMALESLTHRIYTTQSDVWSFGVVIWEVVTVGGAPYPEVAASRLPRLLRAGYRMPKPNNCSKQLYDLMMACWRARPRERPTFSELHKTLDELLNSACADQYLSLELDYEPPPTPKPQRYIRMLLRGNRVWARGESYERPLKGPQGPQSNHYTTPPHSTNVYQPTNCLKNSWLPTALAVEQK